MSNNQDNGDAAAIREALTKVSEWMAHRIATGGFEASPTIPTVLEDVVLPALAKPPRNCDVYDNESCRMAYHLHGDGIMTMQAFADWLFAPANEKGETDGSK